MPEQQAADRQTLDALRLVLWPLSGLVWLSAGLAAFFARDVLIILFLAVLCAIFLTRLTRVCSAASGLSYHWALATVVGGLVVATATVALFLGNRVQGELIRSMEQVEQSRQALQESLRESPGFQMLLEELPIVRERFQAVVQPSNHERSTDATDGAASTGSEAQTLDGSPISAESTSAESSGSEQRVSQAVGAVRSVASGFLKAVGAAISTTFGLLLNSLIIIVVGLFLAVRPEESRDGVVQLFPLRYRERAEGVLDQMGDALWRWLIGRSLSMLVTGVGVGAALAGLGVPLAVSLGVLTGLLTFIPNIGAAIALGLAMFMALPMGLNVMLAVVGVYVAFQFMESYAVTPLIQQYQVSLPPALLLSAQALCGVWLGFLGAMVASPIVVVGLVCNREIYQPFLQGEAPLSNDGS